MEKSMIFRTQRHFVIPFILLLILVCKSSAEDISVSASVDNRIVSVGNIITLAIKVGGTQSAGAPRLPNIEGFQGQYVGPRTQVSIVNNQSSLSISHRYYLKATKTGKFTIPSMVLNYKGTKYKTDPIEVEVVKGDGQWRSKAMTPEDLKQFIRLAIQTRKTTAYLNEGVLLLIRLYIRSGVEVRDIRYPTFPSAGFSVLPFGEATQRQTTIEGVRFRAVDFMTTVYPVTDGEMALGPAELDCNVLLTPSGTSNSLFDRRARYELTIKSDPHTITVKPLPTEGKPKNFSGAVGQYDFDVVAKPTSLKVGEPITLTMTVKGQGNIDMANIPEIPGLDQFKVYDPQIDVKKGGNTGEKTFEQVLIPTSDSVKAIPKIQFSYFDPEQESYITKTGGGTPIQVAPSDEAEPLQILEITEGKAVKREVLGKDIVYIKDEIGPVKRGDGHLYKNAGFLILQFLPLIGFAGILVYQKRRERFATDRTYARQYHAPRKAKKGLDLAQSLISSGKPQEFCSAIFKTVQEYLGDRFDLPVAGITIEVVESLRSRGISEEILEKLTNFFHSCDMIRFAGSDMSENDMNANLEIAREIISLLEDTK